jgi:hypothetical protein
MGEEEMDGVVTVPVLGEHGRYLLLTELVVETLGMGDIVVVGDTSVLRHLAMVGGEKGMHLITVSDIRGEEGSPEMGVALVLVISSGIMIVQVEAHT